MQSTHSSDFIAENNTPALQVIEFDSNDYQANALGIISKSQRDKLYALWLKTRVPPYFYLVLAVTIVPALGKTFGHDIITAVIGMGLVLGLASMIQKRLKAHVLEDMKITSFVGTANPYQDGTGWYIQFDDVMTFEIKDQPNKLFRDGKKYRVFMTQKDNIILSAMEVKE